MGPSVDLPRQGNQRLNVFKNRKSALGFRRTKELWHTFADELTNEAPGIFPFVSMLEP